jgi:hypothetical protein
MLAVFRAFFGIANYLSRNRCCDMPALAQDSFGPFAVIALDFSGRRIEARAKASGVSSVTARYLIIPLAFARGNLFTG